MAFGVSGAPQLLTGELGRDPLLQSIPPFPSSVYTSHTGLSQAECGAVASALLLASSLLCAQNTCAGDRVTGARCPGFLLTQPGAGRNSVAPASTVSTCESRQPSASSCPLACFPPPTFSSFSSSVLRVHTRLQSCALQEEAQWVSFSPEIPEVPQDWRGDQLGRPLCCGGDHP